MTSVSVTRVSYDQRDHSLFVPKRDIGVIIYNFNYIFLTISNIKLFHIYFCIGTFLFREILLFFRGMLFYGRFRYPGGLLLFYLVFLGIYSYNYKCIPFFLGCSIQ